MKKLTSKLVIFIIILFLVAYILQYLLDLELKNSTLGEYKEWNNIINSKINAELLIHGPSRAWAHFSTYDLDSELNMNSYNLGIDGYNFHMQYYRFLLYLKYNKKPNYIIQSIDNTTLSKVKNLYNYSQFLPYLGVDIIKEAVSSYNGLGWAELNIPFYKYRGTLLLPFHSLYFKILKNKSDERYKGFHANNWLWNSSFDEFRNKIPMGYRVYIDSETQLLFNKYLDFCKSEKISVILVASPEYFKAQNLLLNRDSIFNIYKKYASTYNIPILDYSRDSICFDTSNFYNSQHMNVTGVNKFMPKLINDLKKIIVQ